MNEGARCTFVEQRPRVLGTTQTVLLSDVSLDSHCEGIDQPLTSAHLAVGGSIDVCVQNSRFLKCCTTSLYFALGGNPAMSKKCRKNLSLMLGDYFDHITLRITTSLPSF
jgi:hypothetical protein